MNIVKKPRRRQFIIDKKFQYRFIAQWMFLMFLFIGAVGIVFILGLSYIKKHAPSELMAFKEIAFVLKLNAVFVLAMTVLVGLYLVLLSHRIAGPAYRLEKSIQRLIGGDYNFAVTLRKKDYFKPVAHDLNELIGNLREKQHLLEKVNEKIAVLKQRLGNGNAPPEIKELTGQIDEQMSGLMSNRFAQTQYHWRDDQKQPGPAVYSE